MLIEDLVPMEGVIALSADPNVGKTFLMMEMARAVVTGTPFLGKFRTRRGAVLFVGQDASVLDYARQVRKVSGEQWQKHETALEAQREEMGAHPSLVNPFDDLMQYILQPGFYFEDRGHTLALIEAINGYQHSHLERKNVVRNDDILRVDVIEDHKSGFDLILFDTFSSMKMLDENSNTDMQVCMNNLRAIADQTGAACLFAHHHDKAFERLRGASVLSASADVHIELKKKGAGGDVNERTVDTLVTMKKVRGMSVDPFMYKLTTSKDKATILYLENGQVKLTEGAPPEDEAEGVTFDRATQAWCRMLAASEPGSAVRIADLVAHIGTLGRINSRTVYRWVDRYKAVYVPINYFTVTKQAITLTDDGRASLIFALDPAQVKG